MVSLKLSFALCSLNDFKRRYQGASLIVQRVSAAFDASDHPAIIFSSERPQDFSKLMAFFLLWIQGDDYLHCAVPPAYSANTLIAKNKKLSRQVAH
jgi:hypothetical protein